VPGNEFERKLSSAEMCAAGIVASCRKIREINPRCKLIFTLSPVRHYPGELTLNAISKARLLNGIYHALEKFDNAAYFPAYEIQMDELRDYRYYADDMLHPAETAKKILLNRLLDSCFTPDFRAVFQEAEEKRRAAAHRQLHPEVNES
ncbi:MAG: GSCFA domain-containing protein, partial [Lentisphaeria bacterium]|nr:GSCFA domain-containing protein [Lentisphaeria bacterium]